MKQSSGEMRREAAKACLLLNDGSRAPDAAQRLPGDAKHRPVRRCAAEPGPMYQRVSWPAGSRLCAATLARCSASGTRDSCSAAPTHSVVARSPCDEAIQAACAERFLDCFRLRQRLWRTSRCARNDDVDTVVRPNSGLVPRTQRNVSPAMRSIVRFDDALQSRGPCSSAWRACCWVPALHSSVRTLQRVRDTRKTLTMTSLRRVQLE
jgi:hypothetical protein